MKTTINVSGFDLIIEEIDGKVTILAERDGEVIEELALDSAEYSDDEESNDDEVKDFEQFGEELPEGDEDDSDDDSDDEDEDEDDVNESKDGSLFTFDAWSTKK
jgi:hypothetical protein